MPDLERKRGYRISDSMDIQVKIEPVEFDDMANRTPPEGYTAALSAAVSAPVEARHIAEAIGYRALDRPSNFGITF